uniref:glucuronosyltransferase n=1 Tax=Parastrongyloides trichosuri TaxID=131310 RepID=A0A0N4ZLN0_PARTI
MYKLVFILLPLFVISNCYKILICNPKFGFSHVNFFGQIADILHDAGHDVTVLSVNMDLSIKHPGAYKAKIINYPADEEVVKIYSNRTYLNNLWETTDDSWTQLEGLDIWADTIYKQGLKLFGDTNLSTTMMNEKFDFAITEAFGHYFIGLFKIWKIEKYAVAASTAMLDTNYDEFGLSFPTSYVPTAMKYFSEDITFKERFINQIDHWSTILYTYLKWRKPTLYKEFNKRYGKGFFDPRHSLSQASYIFINSNPYFDFPGPKAPKMIEVGGIGVHDTKPLDDYWDEILSKREYNVIISFGTVMKSKLMPKKKREGILEVIKNMPHITFIWKYEEPNDGTNTDIGNLFLTKWFPQSDMLNDKRISLFITHGGAGSITEIAFRGVKTLAIPIMSDQFKNSKLIEKYKIGKVLNKNYLEDPEILKRYIEDILYSHEYSRNAKLLSNILKERPISSKELLIKHVEFACKYGRLPMLELPSIDMNFITYHNLDVILSIIGGILLVIYLLRKIYLNLITVKDYMIKKTQ